MRICELVEAKADKKLVVKTPPARNLVAKHAPKSGAGSHEPKKFKRRAKHKNKDIDK